MGSSREGEPLIDPTESEAQEVMKTQPDDIAIDVVVDAPPPTVRARGPWVFETFTTEGVSGLFTVHADTGRLIHFSEYFDATFQPTDGAAAWQTTIRGSDLQRLRDAAKRTAECEAAAERSGDDGQQP